MSKYLYPIYKSKLKPWIKYWLYKHTGTIPVPVISDWIEGTTPITITNVFKGTKIQELSFFGQISQTGTPTPEVPISIQTVSGTNTITLNYTDAYVVNLKSSNLFSSEIEQGSIVGATGLPNNSDNRIRTKNFIAADASTTYTVTCTGNEIQTMVFQYDSENNYISRITSSWNMVPYSFTTDAGVSKIKIIFSHPNTSDLTPSDVTNTLLNIGSQPITYEPYYDYELCKIGEYSDRIYKSEEDNKWYLEKNIGKAILNEYAWSKFATNITGISRFTSTAIPNVKYVSVNTQLGECLATCYQNHTGNGLSNSPYCVAIDVSMVQATDNSEDNGVTRTKPRGEFYYALAEVSTSEIPSNITLYSQLEAAYNMELSEGSNSLTQTNNDLPFMLKFKYFMKG